MLRNFWEIPLERNSKVRKFSGILRNSFEYTRASILRPREHLNTTFQKIPPRNKVHGSKGQAKTPQASVRSRSPSITPIVRRLKKKGKRNILSFSGSLLTPEDFPPLLFPSLPFHTLANTTDSPSAILSPPPPYPLDFFPNYTRYNRVPLFTSEETPTVINGSPFFGKHRMRGDELECFPHQIMLYFRPPDTLHLIIIIILHLFLFLAEERGGDGGIIKTTPRNPLESD